jgi:hypothetical protein
MVQIRQLLAPGNGKIAKKDLLDWSKRLVLTSIIIN